MIHMDLLKFMFTYSRKKYNNLPKGANCVNTC